MMTDSGLFINKIYVVKPDFTEGDIGPNLNAIQISGDVDGNLNFTNSLTSQSIMTLSSNQGVGLSNISLYEKMGFANGNMNIQLGPTGLSIDSNISTTLVKGTKQLLTLDTQTIFFPKLLQGAGSNFYMSIYNYSPSTLNGASLSSSNQMPILLAKYNGLEPQWQIQDTFDIPSLSWPDFDYTSQFTYPTNDGGVICTYTTYINNETIPYDYVLRDTTGSFNYTYSFRNTSNYFNQSYPGNTYLTFIIKHNSSGVIQWKAHLDGDYFLNILSITEDINGNIYISLVNGKQYVRVLDSAGNESIKTTTYRSTDVGIFQFDSNGIFLRRVFYHNDLADEAYYFYKTQKIYKSKHAGTLHYKLHFITNSYGSATYFFDESNNINPINYRNDADTLKVDIIPEYDPNTFNLYDLFRCLIVKYSDTLTIEWKAYLDWQFTYQIDYPDPMFEVVEHSDGSITMFATCTRLSGLFVDANGTSTPINSPDLSKTLNVLVRISSSGIYQWHKFFGESIMYLNQGVYNFTTDSNDNIYILNKTSTLLNVLKISFDGNTIEVFDTLPKLPDHPETRYDTILNNYNRDNIGFVGFLNDAPLIAIFPNETNSININNEDYTRGIIVHGNVAINYTAASKFNTFQFKNIEVKDGNNKLILSPNEIALETLNDARLKLPDNCVVTSNIVNASVSTSKIAEHAITASKLDSDVYFGTESGGIEKSFIPSISNIVLGSSNAPWKHLYMKDLTQVPSLHIENYPPASLTSLSQTLSGQEYGNGQYVVSASSGNDAWRVFNETLFDQWLFVNYDFNSDGAYTGNEQTVDVDSVVHSGEWLQLQMPVATKITSYIGRATGNVNFMTSMSRSWVLLGSTDGTTWTKLDERNNITWVQAQSQTFPVTSSESFSYFRIVVTKGGTSDHYGLGRSCLSYFRFIYQYHEYSYVGIGTSNPSYMLDVKGDAYLETAVTNDIRVLSTGNNATLNVYKDVSASNMLQLKMSDGMVSIESLSNVLQMNTNIAYAHYDIATDSNLTLDKSTTYLTGTQPGSDFFEAPGIDRFSSKVESDYTSGQGYVHLDSIGNTYVIQKSATIYNMDGSVSALTSPNGSDKKLIKYNLSGEAQWVLPMQRFEAPIVNKQGTRVFLLNDRFSSSSSQVVNNADGTPSPYSLPDTSNQNIVSLIMYDGDGNVLWVNSITGDLTKPYTDNLYRTDCEAARFMCFLSNNDLVISFDIGSSSCSFDLLNTDQTVFLSYSKTFTSSLPFPNYPRLAYIACYDSSGNPKWLWPFDEDGQIIIFNLSVDNNDDIIVNVNFYETLSNYQLKNRDGTNFTSISRPSLTSRWFNIAKLNVNTGVFVWLYPLIFTNIIVASGIDFVSIDNIILDINDGFAFHGRHNNNFSSFNIKNLDTSISSFTVNTNAFTLTLYSNFFVRYNNLGNVLWGVVLPNIISACFGKDNHVYIVFGIRGNYNSFQMSSFNWNGISLPYVDSYGQTSYQALIKLDSATGSLLSYVYLPHNDYIGVLQYSEYQQKVLLPCDTSIDQTYRFPHINSLTLSSEVFVETSSTFKSFIVEYTGVPTLSTIKPYNLPVIDVPDGFCKTLTNPLAYGTTVNFKDSVYSVPPKSSVQFIYNSNLQDWVALQEHVDTTRLLNACVTSEKMNSNIYIQDLTVDRGYIGLLTPSDIKLKTNIHTIEDPLSKIKQLSGCTFNMIASGDRKAGLIAQDVQKVLPEAVTPMPDPQYLAVDYNGIIAMLVESVKNLSVEIEVLKTRI